MTLCALHFENLSIPAAFSVVWPMAFVLEGHSSGFGEPAEALAVIVDDGRFESVFSISEIIDVMIKESRNILGFIGRSSLVRHLSSAEL